MPLTIEDGELKSSVRAKLNARMFGAGGIVTPEQFGALGDGSDETDIMNAIGDWGRANGGLHLRLTPGKTYGYTNNKFLCNMPNFLVVDGNGAALQNRFVSEGGTSDFTMDKECLVFGTAWDEAGPQNINNVWVPYSNAALITADVAAGDTSFTVEAGKGADFTVGQRALIYGFHAQTSAFPITCRFFEYATVIDVTGDTITVRNPIASDYRTDWPATVASSLTEWGPAKAISLSRATFQETTRMVFNDVHFKADPGWADPLRSGRVWIGNYGRAELNACRGDAGMYVMQGQHFVDNGSQFLAEVELDKFVESVTLNAVDYAAISHGTGVKRITLENAVIRKVTNIAADDSITVNGGTLGANPGGGAALPCTWGLNIARFNGVRLLPAASTTALIGYTHYTATFTDAGFNATTRRTRLTISKTDWYASEMYRGIRIGSRLANARGEPVFEVRVMPWLLDASTIAIDGRLLDGGATSPLTLTLHGSIDLDMRGLIQSGDVQVTEPLVAGLYTPTVGNILSRRLTGTTLTVTSSDLREPSTTPALYAIGWPRVITGIAFNVEKAYSGATSVAQLRLDRENFDTDSLENVAVFDLKQTGLRTIDAAGANGAVGTDAISALPSEAMLRAVLRTMQAITYADDSDRAVWSLAITGHPVA